MGARPPEFVVRLIQAALPTPESRQSAIGLGMDVRSAGGGKHVLYGLNIAGSKWNLANVATGISTQGPPPGDIAFYSAQLRVTLAFIAFEAYSKPFKRKWTELKSDLNVAHLHDEIQIIRNATSVKLSDKIRGVLENDKLRKDIVDFLQGEDVNFLSLAAGIRHCFAHGLVGSEKDISYISNELNQLILRCIEEHALGVEQSLNEIAFRVGL